MTGETSGLTAAQRAYFDTLMALNPSPGLLRAMGKAMDDLREENEVGDDSQS